MPLRAPSAGFHPAGGEGDRVDQSVRAQQQKQPADRRQPEQVRSAREEEGGHRRCQSGEERHESGRRQHGAAVSTALDEMKHEDERYCEQEGGADSEGDGLGATEPAGNLGANRG